MSDADDEVYALKRRVSALEAEVRALREQVAATVCAHKWMVAPSSQLGVGHVCLRCGEPRP